jgi:hypothetical protein
MMWRASGSTKPETTNHTASELVALLTDDAVEAVMTADRRRLIAAELRAIADLVLRTDVPLPPTPQPVCVSLRFPDVDLVEAFGKSTGVQVKEAEGQPEWQVFASRQVDGDSGAGVELVAYAYRKAEPAEPAPVAEHYEARGWKGEGDGTGTCGVQCACGVTYDGFDSLAEASTFLALHIADPAGQDYGRADTAEADDPTPVSGGRIQPHTGEMVGTTRDARLVEADAPEPEGRVIGRAAVDTTEADDSESGFRFGQHDDKPLHFLEFSGESTVCGVATLSIPQGEGYTAGRDFVTCPTCRKGLS